MHISTWNGNIKIASPDSDTFRDMLRHTYKIKGAIALRMITHLICNSSSTNPYFPTEIPPNPQLSCGIPVLLTFLSILSDI